MQNSIQKFKQSFIIVFEKPGILSKNWKLWRAPTTEDFNIFGWNFVQVYFQLLQKGVQDFCYFV